MAAVADVLRTFYTGRHSPPVIGTSLNRRGMPTFSMQRERFPAALALCLLAVSLLMQLDTRLRPLPLDP
ncbi:MAG: hypothetical protein KME08_18975 [Aphanothece sp. CMT-3BRIN-NPC111]|nr:hypothetical protein [Aphanothece sp. CMT-3BRIN-NPC111]